MKGRIVGVVLAAGASRRFGARDKLAARISGRAMVQAPARALSGLGLSRRAAITRTPRQPHALRGTGTALWSVGHRRPQAASLRRAVRGARAAGASHLLIVLGDMPGIGRAELRGLLRHGGLHPAMASGGRSHAPPALIPRRLFGPLLRLRGDRGAGALLRRCPDLRRVPLGADALRDVDRPEDLRPHCLR